MKTSEEVKDIIRKNKEQNICRYFITGKTASGKTTLSQYIASQYNTLALYRINTDIPFSNLKYAINFHDSCKGKNISELLFILDIDHLTTKTIKTIDYLLIFDNVNFIIINNSDNFMLKNATHIYCETR